MEGETEGCTEGAIGQTDRRCFSVPKAEPVHTLQPPILPLPTHTAPHRTLLKPF